MDCDDGEFANELVSNVEKYAEYSGKKIIFLIACLAALIAMVLLGIGIGTTKISFVESVSALFSNKSYGMGKIVWDIRMPRILTAVVAGAGLSVAGAVMQGVLRNPLASPYTLGISSAATFGAAAAIVIFGAGGSGLGTMAVIVDNPYVVTISAFLGALLGMAVIILLSVFTRVTPGAMILAGVAMGSLFSAGVAAIQYVADEVQLTSIVYWTFGDLSRITWDKFFIIAAVTLPAIFYFVWNKWEYNALDAGEDTAKGLGVNVNEKRLVGMILASLVTAVIVSFMGIIGFIGLLGPHIVKRLIGSDYRYLIPASAFVGGMILLASDILARVIVAPRILPVGIVTSFLGGPLFIYILLRGYSK